MLLRIADASPWLAQLTPANNRYQWSADGGGRLDESGHSAVCGASVALLLKRAWPDLTRPVMRALFDGQGLPDSARWFDALERGASHTHEGTRYFLAAATIRADGLEVSGRVVPWLGAVLASKYRRGRASGHTMLARSARWVADGETSGTLEVTIWDSTSSPHRPFDSRVDAGGVFHPGLGQAVVRVFVGSEGAPLAWSWHAVAGATIYRDRPLRIGFLASAPVTPEK